MADSPGDSNSDSTSNSETDGNTDPDLEATLSQYLEQTDTALAEYDQGYVDADATLSVLRTHLSNLREAVKEE